MLSKRINWLLFLLLMAAALLRLLWPTDMEWKADEMLMYSMAAESVQYGDLPFIGMKSGAGPDNAGFSVWPFVLMYWFSDHPVQMVVFVQFANILALVIMFICVNKYEGKNKDILMLSLAFMAVNVINIIWSRKIWAQNLLPLFTAAIWLCYVYKHKNITLFIMGLLAALAGQLHISGFFYAAGFLLAVLMFRKFTFLQFQLYAAGFVLGMLPAIPWIAHVFSHHQTSNLAISNILKFEYFLHLFTDPLGINIIYSLGEIGAKDFVSKFNFLPLLLICIVLLSFVIAIIKASKWIKISLNEIKQPSELTFLFLAFAVLPGLLLTLTGIPIRSHYLIAAFPFAGIWLAGLFIHVFQKRSFLLLFPIFLISLLFLFYIHHNHGCTFTGADYGITWEMQ